MRNIKFVLMMVVVCVLLGGCAKKLVKIDESWIQKPSKVKIVFTEPSIGSPKDLADDLPDFVDNFADWYKSQIEENLGRFSNGVRYSVEKVSRDLVTYEFSDMDGSNFKTPKMKMMDESADVYLVMDDLWIGRVVSEEPTCMTTGGFNGMATTTCAPDKFFTGRGRYAFFDAKTGKKLGYGDIESKVGYTFTVSRGDWIDVVRKTVNTMLEDTPIAK